MKTLSNKAILTKEEKVKILLDGIKFKIPFKIRNNFEKYIMFFGSAGVGKSSIIMKLAIRYKQNNKVAIISLINSKTYFDCALSSFCADNGIKHIQLESTMEFDILEEKLKDYDVVLIDTVGRAPCEAELKFEIQMYKRLSEVSFLLVLPSSLKYKDYIDTYNCYRTLNIENIIVSKIDETKYFNSIIKFLNKKHTPLISFISTGKGDSFSDCLVEC